MKSFTSLAGAALLFAAGSAQAQDVPAEPSVQVPESVEAAPIPPSEPMQDQDMSRTFSDQEIAAFAAAGVRMQELREDDTLDDAARAAQARMIVAEAGLDEAKYREIGQAAQADPAVAMRVREAVNTMAADATMEEEPGA